MGYKGTGKPNAYASKCYRCGRIGHQKHYCYAKTNAKGEKITEEKETQDLEKKENDKDCSDKLGQKRKIVNNTEENVIEFTNDNLEAVSEGREAEIEQLEQEITVTDESSS